MNVIEIAESYIFCLGEPVASVEPLGCGKQMNWLFLGQRITSSASLLTLIAAQLGLLAES
jgi:hypothetical protein